MKGGQREGEYNRDENTPDEVLKYLELVQALLESGKQNVGIVAIRVLKTDKSVRNHEKRKSRDEGLEEAPRRRSTSRVV